MKTLRRARPVVGRPKRSAHPSQDPLTKHAWAVQLSAEITATQWQLMKRKQAAKVHLRQILRALTEKKIPFVLTGAHALGGWTGDPRATHDVDILVKKGRNQARAVKAIAELYPWLEVRTFSGIVAFFVPGEKRSVIDVTIPRRADTEVTLASSLWIEKRGLRYRIPALEAILANKYGAMLSLSRDSGKRLQDAADFTKMVEHSAELIDLNKLRALGEMVWPGGGGAEILQLVAHIKQGGVVDLIALSRER